MFAGTVFVRQRTPAPDLTLPRSCWAVYDRLDGETAIGRIADALGLSDAETFSVVRQLQRRDLIEEPVLSYPAYREQTDAETAAEGSASSSGSPESAGGAEQAVSGVGGDGVRSTTSSPAASAGEQRPNEAALHFPTLWDWLEEATDSVKSYKNTQAFVLLEAADALNAIGVSNMGDLENVERCGKPSVVEALETAVQENVDERIPERCYR